LLNQLRQLVGVGADSVAQTAEVVIIDDEPAARYVMSKLLCAKPCRVLEAENGTDALRMIKASSPQLILLDLNMPDISGFEILNRLKTDASTQAIPVAVVTSAILSAAERSLLKEQTCAIINKSALSGERIDQLWQEVLGEEKA
jgi:CheY-like chemotaxis protein